MLRSLPLPARIHLGDDHFEPRRPGSRPFIDPSHASRAGGRIHPCLSGHRPRSAMPSFTRSNREDSTRGRAHDTFGDAPHHQATEPRAASRRHNNEIRLLRCHDLDDLTVGRSCRHESYDLNARRCRFGKYVVQLFGGLTLQLFKKCGADARRDVAFDRVRWQFYPEFPISNGLYPTGASICPERDFHRSPNRAGFSLLSW
jgi:hypothetical protein